MIDKVPLGKIYSAIQDVIETCSFYTNSLPPYTNCVVKQLEQHPEEKISIDEMAQKVLSETENITEAALISGFFDQSHFIRHFEKVVQLTPTEYKVSCKTMSDTTP